MVGGDPGTTLASTVNTFVGISANEGGIESFDLLPAAGQLIGFPELQIELVERDAGGFHEVIPRQL